MIDARYHQLQQFPGLKLRMVPGDKGPTYVLDGAVDLGRALSQFEDNVAAAIRRITSFAQPVFTPVLTTRDYMPALFDMVVADSTSGNINVALPVSTPANAGQTVVVVRTSASNTVTVRVADGSATVLMATSTTFGGPGSVAYRSSGAGWF